MKSTNQYLKIIYLIQRDKEEATTLAIAAKLAIKPASVTEMLKKLAEEKYVTYTPYQGAKLTEKGNRVAKKIMRKHLLLEAFLKNILKLSDKEVCKQAQAMEDSLSDHADQQLCIFLNRPTQGPIDKGSIPHCTKKISCEDCLSGNGEKIRKDAVILPGT